MKKKICFIIVLWVILIPISWFVTALLTEWGVIYKNLDGFYMTGNHLDGIGNFYEISKKIIILPFIIFSGKPITMILVSIIYYLLIAGIVYFVFVENTSSIKSSENMKVNFQDGHWICPICNEENKETQDTCSMCKQKVKK